MERGYRIVKGSQSSKIDLAIAMAMASFGAVTKEEKIPGFHVLDSKKEIDSDEGWVRASDNWNII
ncbi:hypothetical protein ES705_32244 [subsurface metagenome]|nr:hypothetical protein [Clostridia bacterium]